MASGRNFTEDSATDTTLAVQEAQAWIEAVTRQPFKASFREALEDGIILCELMQTIRPGSIPKINRRSNPIAHLDNIRQFLSACKQLGLNDAQLFDVTDLQPPTTLARKESYSNAQKRSDAMRHIRNVCVTLFWLGQAVSTMKDYTGPQLNLKAFREIFTSDGKAVPFLGSGKNTFPVENEDDPMSTLNSEIGLTFEQEQTADQLLEDIQNAVDEMLSAYKPSDSQDAPPSDDVLPPFESPVDETSPMDEGPYEPITIFMRSKNGGFGCQVVGGMDSAVPAKVEMVVPGSAAESSGVMAGDQIIEIDGQNVEDLAHMDIVGLIRKGGTAGGVKLLVHRRIQSDEQEQQFEIPNDYTDTNNGFGEGEVDSSPTALQPPADFKWTKEARGTGDKWTSDGEEEQPSVQHVQSIQRVPSVKSVQSDPSVQWTQPSQPAQTIQSDLPLQPRQPTQPVQPVAQLVQTSLSSQPLLSAQSIQSRSEQSESLTQSLKQQISSQTNQSLPSSSHQLSSFKEPKELSQVVQTIWVENRKPQQVLLSRLDEPKYPQTAAFSEPAQTTKRSEEGVSSSEDAASTAAISSSFNNRIPSSQASRLLSPPPVVVPIQSSTYTSPLAPPPPSETNTPLSAPLNPSRGTVPPTQVTATPTGSSLVQATPITSDVEQHGTIKIQKVQRTRWTPKSNPDSHQDTAAASQQQPLQSDQPSQRPLQASTPVEDRREWLSASGSFRGETLPSPQQRRQQYQNHTLPNGRPGAWTSNTTGIPRYELGGGESSLTSTNPSASQVGQQSTGAVRRSASLSDKRHNQVAFQPTPILTQQPPPPPLRSGAPQVPQSAATASQKMSQGLQEGCSRCRRPLLAGPVMTVPSHRLQFHTACFTCVICRSPLVANGRGESTVQLRRSELHCSFCSSDDKGVKTTEC